MEVGWTKVFTTDKPYQADIVVEVLEENDIHAVAFNKKDSSYVAFGNAEVYVMDEVVEKAKEILKTTSL